MKPRSSRLKTTFYHRRSILRQRDLVRLTARLQRLGDDLQTPITVETANPSVAALAQALDEARRRLSQQAQALAEARQWSEALTQSVAEGIITCDASWRVVALSEGAARITGWDSQAALGKLLDAVLPLMAEDDPLSDRLPPDGARRSVTVRDRSGAAIPLAVARAVSTNGGLVTIVIRDISEETSRRRTQSVFLANMSHEFRTPLAGMEASVEVLQKNLDTFSTAETRQLVSSIHLSLSMLHQLIDNLLESSKLETHHFALNRRTTALEPLLGAAIHLIEPMIARRDQRLTVEEPLTLPPLQVDPTRIIQMIVNLLSNASKYSPVGTLIDLDVRQEGGSLRISVADRGRGVAPEKQSAIFMPFVRLDPQSDQGSGLGLSVVKAIAEAHRGQVGVEARSGGGSIFWVTLPTTEAQ